MAVTNSFPPSMCMWHLHVKWSLFLHYPESGLSPWVFQPIEYDGNDIVSVLELAFIRTERFHVLPLGALNCHIRSARYFAKQKDHLEELRNATHVLRSHLGSTQPSWTSTWLQFSSSTTTTARGTPSEVCPDELSQLTELGEVLINCGLKPSSVDYVTVDN